MGCDGKWIYYRRGALLSFFFVLIFASPVFALDSDNDGLTDELEAIYYTDVMLRDTDGDGYLDAEEIASGYSPLVGGGVHMEDHDIDQDGLNDLLERALGTNMGVTDSDGDGYSDFNEIMHGYNPASSTPAKVFSRKIVVDRSKQKLYYRVGALNILEFPVSTGNPVTPTPAGTFAIQRMLETHRYTGVDYDFPGVKWNMQFFPRYYLHGAYWHNDFGIRTRSHGCVNMRTEDAGLLYQYVTVGFPVEIIGETPKNKYVET